LLSSRPVGADGEDGVGWLSPFPGALPRAFTWHTFGAYMPTCGALCMKNETNPEAFPRTFLLHNLGLFLQFFWPWAPLRIGGGLPFRVDLGFAIL